ncbi:mRNA splicing protein [Martiniozyma asiatica (nom. inval.)]|nr:mRNA splicing protein [Martiniozyma asiatica]
MSTYKRIKLDTERYFDDDNEEEVHINGDYLNFSSNVSKSTDIDTASKLYLSSLERSQFPPSLPFQYKHLEPESKKSSVLDKLRKYQLANPSGDSLDLPEIEQTQQQQQSLIIHDKNSVSAITKTEENKTSQIMKFSKPIKSIVQSLLPQNRTTLNKLITPQMSSPDNGKAIERSSKWEMSKILLGHSGQVTSIAVDPFNKFFISGSSDSTMKVWNLPASNKAKIELQHTLTGHIMAVRGMVISNRHPYLFSCSEDKTVKNWDLEKNKVIRDYHGHLSAVYTIDLHPSKDLVVTGGRDSSIRIWDIRSRNEIKILTGHEASVLNLQCFEDEIISSSADSTVKIWDFKSGQCMETLTHHNKSVRSFVVDKLNSQLISASTNGFRKFKLPKGEYLQEFNFFKNHNSIEDGNLIINTMSISKNNVIFAGCDNGNFAFGDCNGNLAQVDTQVPIPGSLQSEKGIICSKFDTEGKLLITGNVDKSLRIWEQPL